MRQRWTSLDERIADLDAEFTQAAQADERTRRLLTIPGVGALNATALVAAVGDARTFGRGRDLAAWLGLVPRQATTGGKPRLLGITKRGSRYLRKILIQGARSSLPIMSKSDTRLGAWCLATQLTCARPRQHRRGRTGRQDGAYSLGAAAPRAHLQSGCSRGLKEIGRCTAHRLDEVCGR